MKIDSATVNGIGYNSLDREGFIDIFWHGETGFGHVYLYFYDDRNVRLDSEYLTKETVKQIFEKLVDDAEWK